MVKIYDTKGKKRFSVNKNIFALLQRVKQKINTEDQEFWIAFQGDTGSGKSVKAQHWGVVIDKTLDRDVDPNAINRVCFDIDEFINAVNTAKKGQVVIADEAIAIAFSRAAMTKNGRLIGVYKDQIRQKNLCIMLCIPDILDLDYSFVKKIGCLVDVWESRDGGVCVKGNVAVYPEIRGTNDGMKKTQFYMHKKMKKANPFKYNPKPDPLFTQEGTRITRVPWYPPGEKVYKEKKESILKTYKEKDKKPLTKLQRLQLEQRDKAILAIKRLNNLGSTRIGREVGISAATVDTILARAHLLREK